MNIPKLKAKIVEVGSNIDTVAAGVGMSRATFYSRLNGKTDFTYIEIIKLKDYLKLSEDEFNSIFTF